jgi:hypothetical protein
MRVYAFVHHVREEGKVFRRFNQEWVAFGAFTVGPKSAATVPNTGLGFGNHARHEERDDDVYLFHSIQC